VCRVRVEQGDAARGRDARRNVLSGVAPQTGGTRRKHGGKGERPGHRRVYAGIRMEGATAWRKIPDDERHKRRQTAERATERKPQKIKEARIDAIRKSQL
jgi:hypothetical protein